MKDLLRVSVIAALAGVMPACGGTTATPDAGTDSGRTDDDGGPPPVDACAGCGDAGEPDGGPGVEVPPTYAFPSRYDGTASSVSHGGQTARQVLIVDLVSFIESRTEAIDGTPAYEARDVDGDTVVDTMSETVLFDLDYYYGRPAADRADDVHGIVSTPPATPTTYGGLSTSAILRDKLAGNDTSMAGHRDWSTEFRGVSDTTLFRGTAVDLSSPQGFVDAIFSTVAANAEDRAEGVARTGPGGEDLPVHVTARGLHLAELTEKFLFGALTFAQAADEYLDDEAEDVGTGLLAPNTRDGTNAYTTLEHAWDEGFGYLGIPRHSSTIPLADLVGASRAFDANADAMTDLRTEYLFSGGRYLAQRESTSEMLGSPTRFFTEAELALRTGRALIAATPEGATIPADRLTAIQAQRDVAIAAWERGIAATVVRYLNGVVRAMLEIGTAAYAFEAHAQQWSEMKGFALAVQFHRRSPMLEVDGGRERFVTLHELLGDAPVLATASAAERDAYLADLLEARALIGTAYGFPAANLGAADGTGGW